MTDPTDHLAGEALIAMEPSLFRTGTKQHVSDHRAVQFVLAPGPRPKPPRPRLGKKKRVNKDA